MPAGMQWAAPQRVTPSVSGIGVRASVLNTWTFAGQSAPLYMLVSPYQSWLPGAANTGMDSSAKVLRTNCAVSSVKDSCS